MKTNRDLYLAIDALSNQHVNCDRPLETYLLAVLNQSAKFAHRESITLAEFYEVISSGFTDSPAKYEDAWRDEYNELDHEEEGYRGWRATIIRQIVDLREMDECGTLQNELRYFGVESPRKSHWYNFDPHGFLECAVAGSFDGWAPSDNTGRDYVSGPVAVLDDAGSIELVHPEDVPNPVFEMPSLTWEHFKDFIFCGQSYE